jgi:hypothetical protein
MLSCFFLLSISITNAQSDYQQVYDLFQAKCTSCHGGSNPQGNLALDGNLSTVYNAIKNMTPTNPAAAASGQKLIVPGRPDQSFLLRKVAYADWDDYYGELEVAEGNQMPPNNLPKLEKHEVELLRQWILHGASVTSFDVKMDIIEDYYTNGGLPFIERPDPPAPGEGFQLRMGPIFLAPEEEQEYFKYQDMALAGDTEINRIDLTMNDESHHFLMYHVNDNPSVPQDGLIPILETQNINMSGESVISAWQDSHPHVLPEKTAYFWDENTIVNLNFHAKNYNSSLTLPIDGYINVYTQPSGTAEQEMFADLFIIGATSGNNLSIPNSGNEIVVTDAIKTNQSFPMYVWSLTSHTHQLGTDYDIYLRNPNGTKGEQIYEGYYNFDYTFNQGFYDWEHPPIRTFEEPLFIDLKDGLIHEAKYVNNTDSYVYWGITTEDEMMLFYAHYTKEALTSTEEVENQLSIESSLKVSPNPFTNQTYINYELKHSADVQVEVFDLLGNRVSVLANGDQMPGRYSQEFVPENDLSSGLYLVRLTVDGKVFSSKFSYLK